MSTESGRQAEHVAAAYLAQRGHQTLAQNWRTRWCEIDVITLKDKTVYFVEVKYRGTSVYGSGLDYITPKKLAQMQFAAQFWMAKYPRAANDYRLAAVEVAGTDYEVTAWLDDL